MIFRLIFLLFCILLSCNRSDISDYDIYLNHNDTVKYVGKESCRACHAEIYDSYIQTGMGKSFHYAIKENSDLPKENIPLVYDSIKNLFYKPFWKNDSLYLLEFRLRNSDTTHKLVKKITYKIGSGHHTNSHLFNINGYIHQAPYTFYTQDSVSGLPPGFENGLNSRFTREIGLECMSCHNGYADHQSQSTNKYKSVPEGIDCERCHGPGELHIKEKLAGNIIDTSKYIDYTIVNPAKLDRDLQFDICQRCHLQGTAVLNNLSTFNDFKPGMSLEEIMDVYVPKHPNNNEFIMASHVDRLKQSDCYSNSEMTCVTCHNPHKSVTTLSNDYFDKRCMSCHDVCKDKEIQNCTSCHMPKSTTKDIMHVSITDHKISIPNNDIEDDYSGHVSLISVNNDNPTNLSKAKAYLKHYESFVSYSHFLDSAYYFLLKSDNNFTSFVQYYYLKADDVGLKEFVMNSELDTSRYRVEDLALSFARIGEVLARNEMIKSADKYFQKSLFLMPFIIDYKLKYSTFLIKNNQIKKASIILKESIQLNPTIKELYLNLGYIDMLNKDYSSSEIRFKQAIGIDPDYLLAYENLVILSQIQEKDKELKLYIDKIIEIDSLHLAKEILN